jgi:hypothetical protein
MRPPPGGRRVYVSTVRPDFTATGRVGYKVTLSCGCRFWELRDQGAPAPDCDTPARCFADHTTVAPNHLN